MTKHVIKKNEWRQWWEWSPSSEKEVLCWFFFFWTHVCARCWKYVTCNTKLFLIIWIFFNKIPQKKEQKKLTSIFARVEDRVRDWRLSWPLLRVATSLSQSGLCALTCHWSRPRDIRCISPSLSFFSSLHLSSLFFQCLPLTLFFFSSGFCWFLRFTCSSKSKCSWQKFTFSAFHFFVFILIFLSFSCEGELMAEDKKPHQNKWVKAMVRMVTRVWKSLFLACFFKHDWMSELMELNQTRRMLWLIIFRQGLAAIVCFLWFSDLCVTQTARGTPASECFSIVSSCFSLPLHFYSLYVYTPSSTRGKKLLERLGNLRRPLRGCIVPVEFLRLRSQRGIHNNSFLSLSGRVDTWLVRPANESDCTITDCGFHVKRVLTRRFFVLKRLPLYFILSSWTCNHLHVHASMCKICTTKWLDDFNCPWQTCHRRGMFWIHPLILRASFLFALNIHLAQHPSWTPCRGFFKKINVVSSQLPSFSPHIFVSSFLTKCPFPLFSLYPPYSIFLMFYYFLSIFSNNPYILTITWFCSCWRFFFSIHFLYIYIFLFVSFFFSFRNSAVKKNESLSIFSFIKFFFRPFSLPFCFIFFIFLISSYVSSFFFTFTFSSFLNNNFFLFIKKTFRIIPFTCMRYLLLSSSCPPCVHLLSLLSHLVFSCLSHLFSFSFICFLCPDLVVEHVFGTSAIFCLCTFLLGILTYLCVFACLSFLSFFFEGKKVSIFVFILCFWTFSFVCSLSWTSVFPLFLLFNCLFFWMYLFFWRFFELIILFLSSCICSFYILPLFQRENNLFPVLQSAFFFFWTKKRCYSSVSFFFKARNVPWCFLLLLVFFRTDFFIENLCLLIFEPLFFSSLFLTKKKKPYNIFPLKKNLLCLLISYCCSSFLHLFSLFFFLSLRVFRFLWPFCFAFFWTKIQVFCCLFVFSIYNVLHCFLFFCNLLQNSLFLFSFFSPEKLGVVCFFRWTRFTYLFRFFFFFFSVSCSNVFFLFNSPFWFSFSFFFFQKNLFLLFLLSCFYYLKKMWFFHQIWGLVSLSVFLFFFYCSLFFLRKTFCAGNHPFYFLAFRENPF